MPYSDSSIVETDGYIQVKNRGRIATKQTFSSPHLLTGRFQRSGNVRSNGKIVLRTDGGLIGVSEMRGVAIQFQVQEDFAVQNQIGIFTIGAASDESASKSKNISLSLDTWYDFEILDTGTSIQLWFNNADSPTLSLNTDWSAGGLIGFYNREGSAGGSTISNGGIGRLDALTVSSPVPEPYTIAMWSLLGLCGVGYGLRRKTKKTF